MAKTKQRDPKKRSAAERNGRAWEIARERPVDVFVYAAGKQGARALADHPAGAAVMDAFARGGYCAAAIAAEEGIGAASFAAEDGAPLDAPAVKARLDADGFLSASGQRSAILSLPAFFCLWARGVKAGDGASLLRVLVEGARLHAPAERDKRPILPFAGSAPTYAPPRAWVVDRSAPPPLPESNGGLPLIDLPDDKTGAAIQLVSSDSVPALRASRRGARPDKAMAIIALADTPMAMRSPGSVFPFVRPLRWWRAHLFASAAVRGRSPITAARAAAKVNAGLAGLNGLVVQPGKGGAWIPVTCRSWAAAELDAPIRLEVCYPAELRGGASVDRGRLIAAIADSDPALDVVIGLACMWDKAKTANGLRRVYATRPAARRNADGHLLDSAGAVITSRGDGARRREDGSIFFADGDKPVSDWRHPRAVLDGFERNPAVSRVPELSPGQRRRMAFPANGGRPSWQRARADALIAEAACRGEVVIETRGAALDRRLLQRVLLGEYPAGEGALPEPAPPTAADRQAWAAARSAFWRVIEAAPRSPR